MSYPVWDSYPHENRNRYIRAITAFATLTPLFKQKASNVGLSPDKPFGDTSTMEPFILSKYQESAFARFIGGKVVDTGNIPYDIQLTNPGTGQEDLVGIKTFLQSSSGYQKVMQFKAEAMEQGWTDLLRFQLTPASVGKNNLLELVRQISLSRNLKLLSAQNNLLGVSPDNTVQSKLGESFYHYLTPRKGGLVNICETTYDAIKIENLRITGTTETRGSNGSEKIIKTVSFTDGYKNYKYNVSDSTLFMEFNHRQSFSDGGDILGTFDVPYLRDPYTAILSLLGTPEKQAAPFPMESLLIEQECDGLEVKGRTSLPDKKDCVVFPLIAVKDNKRYSIKAGDVFPRSHINLMFSNPKNTNIKATPGNTGRPVNEVEIQIREPNKFHKKYPDFFGYNDENKPLSAVNGKISIYDKDHIEQRTFDMYFGNATLPFRCYLYGDNLKNISSQGNMTIIGKWIREDVLQVPPSRPVTREDLDKIGLNGYRLTRIGNRKVKLEVIKITTADLPYLWGVAPSRLAELIDIPDPD
ncbi:hypothetical protein ACN08Z_05990 [Rothia sp. P7181]|uniref:hypothetical protein n=1 Tax=Rothia sp. P7181 TaxID=3402663 RepID=UPI003ADA35C1